MGERLSQEEVDSNVGRGHVLRYRLAAGFVEPGDTVLDAACGIGYGAEIFRRFPGCTYVGVDLNPVSDEFQAVNLETWKPKGKYDVAVSFETIEHLDDYSNLINILKRAKKWIIVSVPVVPTVHMNPWHKHDFAPQELPGLIEDADWEYYQYLPQPTELAEIYVFRRLSSA